jgi:putative addiction module antidote
MAQILRTVGENVAVIIPPDLLEQHGLKAGDLVHLISTEQGINIVPDETLDPDFRNAVRFVMQQHHEVLKRLADFDTQKP